MVLDSGPLILTRWSASLVWSFFFTPPLGRPEGFFDEQNVRRVFLKNSAIGSELLRMRGFRVLVDQVSTELSDAFSFNSFTTCRATSRFSTEASLMHNSSMFSNCLLFQESISSSTVDGDVVSLRQVVETSLQFLRSLGMSVEHPKVPSDFVGAGHWRAKLGGPC